MSNPVSPPFKLGNLFITAPDKPPTVAGKDSGLSMQTRNWRLSFAVLFFSWRGSCFPPIVTVVSGPSGPVNQGSTLTMNLSPVISGGFSISIMISFGVLHGGCWPFMHLAVILASTRVFIVFSSLVVVFVWVQPLIKTTAARRIIRRQILGLGIYTIIIFSWLRLFKYVC